MGTETVISAALRGLHLVALASLFGTLVSLALVAPAGLREAGAAAPSARQRLVRLARWSAALALLFGVGWMLLEAATIAGTSSVGATFGVLGKVVRDTQFGQLILVRFALLLLAFPFLDGQRWRIAPALLLTGAALGMQGCLGHAGAIGGSVGTAMLISEALHLLAAGAWLGGLLPLFLLVGALPPRAAAAACESFTPVGLSAVVAIACTAVVQASQLIGGLGRLFGTAYGHIALVKIALFLLLLLLAAINRFALTRRLHEPARSVAPRLLRMSVGIEATLGAAVIVVAAFLASSEPATHETPVWPFSRQLSPGLLADPYARELLFFALLPSLIAAALVAAGCWLWRPIFWPALAGLVVCLVLAWPDVEPLVTLPAYPTTFDTSPSGFAASSIVRGKVLFAADCAACHGTNGRGNGTLAASLSLPPGDLTAPHLLANSEGDLYWFVAHGMETSPGVFAMPAFGKTLSSDEIWSLIDFLKANNAGYELRTTGRWNHPTPLPQFNAVCADGSAVDRDDLRGRVVHFIATDHSVTPPPVPAGINVVTIVLALKPGVKPIGAACVTVQPSVPDAFAILLGAPVDALVGTLILADQNLWLRQYWRPGDSGDWNDPRQLASAIRAVAAHPLAADAGGAFAHHH